MPVTQDEELDPRKFKVATYTDFGESGRKSLIGQHKNISTAMRQYARIWEIYGRPNRDKGTKVWQEMIPPHQ